MSTREFIFVTDERVLPFVTITTAALDHLAATVDRKALAYVRSIYLALVEVAGQRATFSSPLPDLAARAGLGVSTLKKYLPQLEATGLAEVQKTAGWRSEKLFRLFEVNGAVTDSRRTAIEAGFGPTTDSREAANRNNGNPVNGVVTDSRETANTRVRATSDVEVTSTTNYNGKTSTTEKTTTTPTAVKAQGVEDCKEEKEGEEMVFWRLPPEHEDWGPKYAKVSSFLIRHYTTADGEGENAIRAMEWEEPAPEDVVFDLWRDLYWHWDARLTPSRLQAIKTALTHYDGDDGLAMVCRAVAGGKRDPFLRGENEEKRVYDKLETLIAVTSARDNVDRLGHLVGEEELDDFIERGLQNRQNYALWRREDFTRLDEQWRVKNRHALQKDAGRYRRHQRWLDAKRSVVA